MDELEQFLIERACARLITEYCHFVDHGEAGKISGQFTEDGVWASASHVLDRARGDCKKVSEAPGLRGADVASCLHQPSDRRDRRE